MLPSSCEVTKAVKGANCNPGKYWATAVNEEENNAALPATKKRAYTNNY